MSDARGGGRVEAFASSLSQCEVAGKSVRDSCFGFFEVFIILGCSRTNIAHDEPHCVPPGLKVHYAFC